MAKKIEAENKIKPESQDKTKEKKVDVKEVVKGFKVKYFAEVTAKLTITFEKKLYSYEMKNGIFICDKEELKPVLLNMNCQLLEG